MLLTIHNLPPDIKCEDVRNIIVKKCGINDLILDNLLDENGRKKVTVGLADEGDAALLVRKINGLYVDGCQLYVENVRQKQALEQPYRSSSNYTFSPQQHGFENMNKYQQKPRPIFMNAVNPNMTNNMQMGGVPLMGGLYRAPAQSNFMGARNPQPLMGYQGGQQLNQQMPSYGLGPKMGINDNVHNWERNRPPQRGDPSFNIGTKHSQNYERGFSVTETPNTRKWNETDNFDGQGPRAGINAPTSWVQENASFQTRYSPSGSSGLNNSNNEKSNWLKKQAEIENKKRQEQSNYRTGENWKDQRSYQRSPISERQSEPNQRAVVKPWQDQQPNSRGPNKPWQNDQPNPKGLNKPWQNDQSNPKGLNKPNSVKPWQQQPNQPYPQGPRKPWQNEKTKPSGSNKPWQINQLNYKVPNKPGQTELSNSRGAIKPWENKQAPPKEQPKWNEQRPQEHKGQPQKSPIVSLLDVKARPQKRASEIDDDIFNGPPIKRSALLNEKRFGNKPGKIKITRDMTRGEIKVASMLKKDLKCRASAASCIGRGMIGHVRLPENVKYYALLAMLKKGIMARIDMALGDRLSASETEVIELYREKFLITDDEIFCKAVIEDFRHGEKRSKDNIAEEQKSASVAEKKKEAAGGTKPTDNITEVQKSASVAENKEAAGGTKPSGKTTVGSTKATNKNQVQLQHENMTCTSVVLKIFNEQKDLYKLECENDNLYELSPEFQKAVDEQIEVLSNMFKEELSHPEDDDEKEICKRIISGSVDEFKKTIRLHTIKRLLNITTSLLIVAYGRKLKRQVLNDFLSKYDVTFQNSDKNRYFIIKCNSFDSFDKLCSLKDVYLGDEGEKAIFKPLNLVGKPIEEWRLRQVIGRAKSRRKRDEVPDDVDVTYEAFCDSNKDDFTVDLPCNIFMNVGKGLNKTCDTATNVADGKDLDTTRDTATNVTDDKDLDTTCDTATNVTDEKDLDTTCDTATNVTEGKDLDSTNVTNDKDLYVTNVTGDKDLDTPCDTATNVTDNKDLDKTRDNGDNAMDVTVDKDLETSCEVSQEAVGCKVSSDKNLDSTHDSAKATDDETLDPNDTKPTDGVENLHPTDEDDILEKEIDMDDLEDY